MGGRNSSVEGMAMIFPHEVVRRDLDSIHENAHTAFVTLSGNNLLLTGAGGFLGYYFILAIAFWNELHPKDAIHLTAVSRFHDGTPPWLSRLTKVGITALSRDVTKDSFLDDGPYDYIVHAASFASPLVYRRHPIETMTASVFGLHAILDKAAKDQSSRKRLKRLLYFSSSEIYGDPPAEWIPTPEHYQGNVSCTGPRACYDESKRFCETLAVNFVRVYGLPIVTVRPFNNYGPGMKITDGRVIADFSRNILRNEDIVMYSTGAPTRTYCYVADAMIGYIKALARGKAGEAYNIGVESPEISVNDLAGRMVDIAKDHFGYRGRVRTAVNADTDYLTDNPMRRCPSIGKARDALGYRPTISLDDGLYRTLIWYKARDGVKFS